MIPGNRFLEFVSTVLLLLVAALPARAIYDYASGEQIRMS